MMVACIVKIWSYCSGVTKLLFATASCVLMISASTPPNRKKKNAVYMYMMPIFL